MPRPIRGQLHPIPDAPQKREGDPLVVGPDKMVDDRGIVRCAYFAPDGGALNQDAAAFASAADSSGCVSGRVCRLCQRCEGGEELW